MEKKNMDSSDRRRFIRKLAKLGAAGGVSALLLGEKTLIHPVEASAYLTIDAVNTGTGTTQLNSSGGRAFVAEATAETGLAYGIVGYSNSTSGIGVAGWVPATSGETRGVSGGSNSIYGTGVYGYAVAPNGPTMGVAGYSDSQSGTGVYGEASWPIGQNVGVSGLTKSTDGKGVKGLADATSGHTYGVDGESWSTGGTGVRGIAWAEDVGAQTKGVFGWSRSPSGRGVEGLADAPDGSTIGVLGQSNSTAGVGVGGIAGGIGILGRAGDTDAIPIVAIGAWPFQTANLQEWRNDAGTSLSVVDKNGQFGVGTGSPAFKIHVVGTVDPTALTFDSYGIVASNIIGRRARGTVASPSAAQTDDALLILNARGYGATGFSPWSRAAIRLCAAENWTDAAQGTYIRFDTTANGTATNIEKMRINHDGRVGIGTTAPTERLHVVGKIRATQGFITGDIEFANNFTVTEDEKHGIAFKNDAGEKIAVLDRKGNLHIKGDVVKDL